MKSDIERIIYKPWSSKVLSDCIDAYRKGQVPVLNLELSAKCSFCSCLYCDSKVSKAHPQELSAQETVSLIQELYQSYGLKWIYICGLGEPTEDPKLLKILECSRLLGIEVSMFTNGMGIEHKEIPKLSKYPLNIALKLDSFNEVIFETLLGRRGAAAKIYSFLNTLLESGFVKVKHRQTNLSLSIVPTKSNRFDIDEIVKFCKAKKIFPAIGEMETSNKAKINYASLALNRKQLVSLKSRVSDIIGYEYERPLCPGIVPSLHITNKGDCVVDDQTGLSCGWFFMKEPRFKLLGSIRHDPLKEIIKSMHAYRQEKKYLTEGLLKQHNPVFGGGGSQPRKWYRLYFSSLNEYLKSCQRKGDFYGHERKGVLRNISVRGTF